MHGFLLLCTRDGPSGTTVPTGSSAVEALQTITANPFVGADIIRLFARAANGICAYGKIAINTVEVSVNFV